MNKANIKPNTALKKPRITEKAAILAEAKNVYTFEVESDATKKSIAASIKEAYKVTPLSVRIARIPNKSVWRKGKKGVKRGGKKAYVYLKKGDKIETI